MAGPSPLLKPLYELIRTGALKKQWTLRRFPPAGRFILLIYGATIAFTVDVRFNTNYQLFVVSITLLALAVMVGLNLRGSFRITRRLPATALAGEPFLYDVDIMNATKKKQQGLLLMDDPDWSAPAYSVLQEQWLEQDKRPGRGLLRNALRNAPTARIPDVAVEDVPPHGVRTVTVQATPTRRGVLSFQSATLGVADPLGLFCGLFRIPAADKVIVLPKRHQVPKIQLPSRRTYQLRGINQAMKVGDSMEFAGLREYRPGDPLKDIHWRSMARLGVPVVKEFHEEWFSRQALVLDTFSYFEMPDGSGQPRRRPTDPELFEEAVEVAASFAVMDRPDDAILDLLFMEEKAYRFSAGRALGSSEAMLKALAGVECCFAKDFHLLADVVLYHAKVISGAILILLAWDAPRQALVAALQSAGVAVEVYLLTGKESLPPPARPWLHPLRSGHIQEDLLA